MKARRYTRRDALKKAGLAMGTGLVLSKAQGRAASASSRSNKPFVFCLNTATIRGQKLGIVKEIELASKAGYDAIEPWIDAINDYVKAGGSLPDLRKRLEDSGLVLASAIGFPQWIVDDSEKRAKGLEQAKREMDIVAKLGGKRLAAPPAGATDTPGLNLLKAAERYRALLDAGDQIGVVPQLELWGFSKNLNHLGECFAVAMETGHPKAAVLADVYHLYKGGSDYHGIRMAAKDTIQILHMNDYPADPPREKIDDSQRVFPGEGVAPVTEILQLLHNTGGQKILSVEIFSRKHWGEDAASVVKQGLESMKAAAAKVKI